VTKFDTNSFFMKLVELSYVPCLSSHFQ